MALNRCQAGEWDDYTRLPIKQQIAFRHLCASLRDVLIRASGHEAFPAQRAPHLPWLLSRFSPGYHGTDECLEQRVRVGRPRFELRMELAAEHERVIGELGDLYEKSIGRKP